MTTVPIQPAISLDGASDPASGATAGGWPAVPNWDCGSAGVTPDAGHLESLLNELELLARDGEVDPAPDADHDRSPPSSWLASLQRVVGELKAAQQDTRHLQQSLHQKIQEQSQYIDLIAAEARKDPLTGIANQRMFERELAARSSDARRSSSPLSLIILDIDHFKNLNDQYGHRVGDQVLKDIALGLQRAVRGDDLVARYGGEEFAILLGGSRAQEAVSVADRVRAEVAAAIYRYDGKSIRATISCGMAQLLPREHASQLLQRADAALYHSKQHGRNLVSSHNGRGIERMCEGAAPQATTGTSDPAESRPLVAGFEHPLEAVEEASAAASFRPPNQARNACWCDSRAIFSWTRQRIEEWKRGGDVFSVVVAEVHTDIDPTRLSTTAKELLRRTCAFCLDASVRKMDVLAGVAELRFVVLLPRCSAAGAAIVVERLRNAENRVALPTRSGQLQFAFRLGMVEVHEGDDAARLLDRASEQLQRGTASQPTALSSEVTGKMPLENDA